MGVGIVRGHMWEKDERDFLDDIGGSFDGFCHRGDIYKFKYKATEI